MGLRCLIGHDYGPPETERDREERGDEVVVTIREFKECERCGDRQVISENTEVRAREPSTGDRAPASGESSEDATSAASATETGSAPGGDFEDVSAEDDDGVILSEGDADESQEEWPGADDRDDEASGDRDGDDSEVDGVAEEGTDGDREADESREWPESETDESGTDDGGEPREWPDAADREAPEEASEPREWPEAEGEDEGYDAVAGNDASVEDVEFGGGLTPERSGGGGGEADAREVTPAGITSAAPGPEPIGPQRSDDPGDTTLVCPECDHVAGGQGPSLRPGDICPECRRGYLAERGSE